MDTLVEQLSRAKSVDEVLDCLRESNYRLLVAAPCADPAEITESRRLAFETFFRLATVDVDPIYLQPADEPKQGDWNSLVACRVLDELLDVLHRREVRRLFFQKHDPAATKCKQVVVELLPAFSSNERDRDQALGIRPMRRSNREELRSATDGSTGSFDRAISVSLSDMVREIPYPLPEIAVRDFLEGDRCLSHDLPTAASCMFLRGVEAALNEYLRRVTGIPGETMTWDAKERHLEHLHQKQHTSVVHSVRDLRVTYRNETMHPSRQYNKKQAERLVFLCAEALHRMSEAL